MAKIKEFQSAEQQTVVVKALRYSYICEMHKRWLSWAESKWLPPWNVADECPSSSGSSALVTKLFSRQPFWTELIKLHWSARFLFIFIIFFLFREYISVAKADWLLTAASWGWNMLTKSWKANEYGNSLAEYTLGSNSLLLKESL